MSRAREVVRQVGLYASASCLTQLLAVIAGILTRNFLGPFSMGIWATVQLVMSYCEYSSLGIDVALSREFPFYVGRGDKRGADRVKDLVMSFGLVTALVTALGVLCFSLIFNKGWERYLFWGFLAIPAFLILQRLNNLIVAWLRASKQFELASLQIVFSGLANLLLILVFASQLNFPGLLIAIFLSLLFNVVFLLKKSKFSFVFRLEREIIRLISFGLPLTVLAILFDLLRSVDKILVIRYLGFEEMGIYGVATMATVLVSKIPDSIVIVLIPHFHEKFGERESAEDLRGIVDQSATAYGLIMPLVIGIAWICAEPFVRCLLPKFTDAVPSMKLLLLSAYFFALFYPYSNFLIAIKRHLILFPIITGALVFQLLGTLAVIRGGYGLQGVALVANVSYLVSFLGLFALAARVLYQWAEVFKKLFFSLGLFAVLSAVLLSLDRWCAFSVLWQRTAFQLFLFLIFSAPLWLVMEKKFNILAHVRELRGRHTTG